METLTDMTTHNGWPVAVITAPGPFWYACDEPERPADDWTVWVAGCDGCTIGLVAAVKSGRMKATYTPAGTHKMTPTHLRICLEHARQFREEQGLRTL